MLIVQLLSLLPEQVIWDVSPFVQEFRKALRYHPTAMRHIGGAIQEFISCSEEFSFAACNLQSSCIQIWDDYTEQEIENVAVDADTYANALDDFYTALLADAQRLGLYFRKQVLFYRFKAMIGDAVLLERVGLDELTHYELYDDLFTDMECACLVPLTLS